MDVGRAYGLQGVCGTLRRKCRGQLLVVTLVRTEAHEMLSLRQRVDRLWVHEISAAPSRAAVGELLVPPPLCATWRRDDFSFKTHAMRWCACRPPRVSTWRP